MSEIYSCKVASVYSDMQSLMSDPSTDKLFVHLVVCMIVTRQMV